jgi:hypothetical protein
MINGRFRFVLVILVALLAPAAVAGQEGDPAALARMQQINAKLRSMGLGIAVEQIDFFHDRAGPSKQPYSCPDISLGSQ